ncbi:hypothetical protein SAY86_027410 [Trapa natans]|nr:hypothetical protein SAY86_027410 [Trapa natans]
MMCFVEKLQAIAGTSLMERKSDVWKIGWDMNLLVASYAVTSVTTPTLSPIMIIFSKQAVRNGRLLSISVVVIPMVILTSVIALILQVILPSSSLLCTSGSLLFKLGPRHFGCSSKNALKCQLGFFETGLW